jgi:hypothetical protein
VVAVVAAEDAVCIGVCFLFYRLGSDDTAVVAAELVGEEGIHMV